MKKLLVGLFGLGLALGSVNAEAAEGDKAATAPAKAAPAAAAKAAPAKAAAAKAAPAAAAKAAPAKCAAQAKAVAAAAAAVKVAAETTAKCKAKYKRTHLLRCRKQRKADKAAAVVATKAMDNHKVCMKGCSWLGGVAQNAAAAYKACRKAHRFAHLVRCRKQKKKMTSYAAQFKQCQRFRKKK